jgi:hypothetical protein
LFAGVGTAGALAAVATIAPQVVHEQAAAPAAPQPAPDKGGGYQLSEHVKRYYKTTLV